MLECFEQMRAKLSGAEEALWKVCRWRQGRFVPVIDRAPVCRSVITYLVLANLQLVIALAEKTSLVPNLRW